MALNRVWIASPNFYVGHNARRLLVCHSSEGDQDFRSLGGYFANSANQVSSHVGIDNQTRGTIGEYVRRSNSAWTAANANTVAVQAECCTPSGASANWSTADWMARPVMLANLADWLREESKATGIPLVRLTPAQAQGTGRGVCEHLDLGAWGGGHVDCGPNFPLDHVIAMAKGQPATGYEDEPMICAFTNTNNGNQEAWEVNPAGNLWHRWWVPATGWSTPVNRGGGYVGSPSFSVNSKGTMCVFVQKASGAPDCWSLGNVPGASWSKVTI